MKILKVPKNIGKGEGGGDLPKLYDIFKQIDEELYKLNTKEEPTDEETT